MATSEYTKENITTLFFISNTYISIVRLNLAKIWLKLSNTPSLNSRYLKIICFVHPRCHSKIIRNILKNGQIISGSVLMTFVISGNENEAENEKLDEKDTTYITPTHGHKYTECKMCLSIMMIIMYQATPKQHLKLNSQKSETTLRLS